MGAQPGGLTYASLVELKLAAGHLRDQADVVELLRENPNRVEELRKHLEGVHPIYLEQFESLLEEANGRYL